MAPVRLQRNSGQPVVRIIVRRFETQDFLLLVGQAVAIRVFEQQHLLSRHHVNRAVVAHQQIHCMPKTLGKRAPMVEPPIAIRVGHHANAIACRPLVIFRALMRVRFDHQQSALAVERHPDRRDDLRLLGHQLQLVPAIGNARFGRFADIDNSNPPLDDT